MELNIDLEDFVVKNESKVMLNRCTLNNDTNESFYKNVSSSYLQYKSETKVLLNHDDEDKINLENEVAEDKIDAINPSSIGERFDGAIDLSDIPTASDALSSDDFYSMPCSSDDTNVDKMNGSSYASSSNSKFDIPLSTLDNIQKVSDTATESRVEKKSHEQFEESDNFLMTGIPAREAPKVGDICMIGHAESPSEIYIQVADVNSVSLDNLTLQLCESYQNSFILCPTKLAALKKHGDFWILKYKNEMYRVEVVDWLLDEKTDEVVVQLIDYGWKYWVEFGALRPLDKEFRQLPRMVQVCHLGYLYAPGIPTQKKKPWQEAVYDDFYKTLGNLENTCFRIVHVYYSKKRKSYEIDLIKTEEEHEENTIGQILIDHGVAVTVFQSNSELMGCSANLSE